MKDCYENLKKAVSCIRIVEEEYDRICFNKESLVLAEDVSVLISLVREILEEIELNVSH